MKYIAELKYEGISEILLAAKATIVTGSSIRLILCVNLQNLYRQMGSFENKIGLETWITNRMRPL